MKYFSPNARFSFRNPQSCLAALHWQHQEVLPVTFGTGRRYNPACHSLCHPFYLLVKNCVIRTAQDGIMEYSLPGTALTLWFGSSFSHSLQLVGKYPPVGPEDRPSISYSFPVRYGFESSQRKCFYVQVYEVFFYVRDSKHKIWDLFYMHSEF